MKKKTKYGTLEFLKTPVHNVILETTLARYESVFLLQKRIVIYLKK